MTASGGKSYTWGSAANWAGGIVPDAPGDTAALGAVAGGGTATISLNAAELVGGLTFSPGAGGRYVVNGGGIDALQMATTGGSASIAVNSGSAAINAPVVLNDNVNVTAASGTSLTISGSISQGNNSSGLTLSGGGNLTLSGVNTYTGGTTLNGGTLTVANAAALPKAA